VPLDLLQAVKIARNPLLGGRELHDAQIAPPDGRQ